VEDGLLDLDRPMAQYSEWAEFCRDFSEQPSIFAQGLRCEPPREATRIANNVVVATMTGVADGKPIVSRSEDGTYVTRIPTQRVTFSVMDSRKGDLAENETFVLFQNGNYQNRFDEDPSYKMGQTYLLFLSDRGDGTHMVISPEGRYEVTQKGLAPVTENSFAASLKGAQIEDVIRDVQRALEE
jgi:hypothetical protein